MANEDLSYDPPPRKSGGASVLLWILGIAALCLVLCCGAVGVMAWRFGAAAKNLVANFATSDPVEIRKQTAEIVDIAIPDEYQPVTAMNMVAFRFVMYQTGLPAAGSNGMLMLMEMTMEQMGVDPDEQELELRKSMQQQQ